VARKGEAVDYGYESQGGASPLSMIVTIVGNIIDMLLKKQETTTSEDVKTVLKRANIQISDSELIHALMTLEIYKKIYVRRIRREGREIFQISRRR
jgi:hypothetical protein